MGYLASLAENLGYSYAEKLPTHLTHGFMTTMLRIALANGKGGTTKTSTTIHLADALAAQGARVLVVDLDDQANCTKFLRADLKQGTPSVGELLLQRASLSDTIRNARNGIHIVPARRGLLSQSLELLTVYYNQERLAMGLEEGEGIYDIGLFDCPPALSVLTANAIFAADWLLVPTTLDPAAYDGLDDLLAFSRSVRRDPMPHSILISAFDARKSKVNRNVEPALVANYNTMDLRIPTCEAVKQAHSALCSLAEIKPRSRAWQAFKELAKIVVKLQKESKDVAAA